MALFSTPSKKAEETAEAPKAQKSAPKPKKAEKQAVRESVLANKVLMRPRITEKSYTLNALNQYVFEVARHAHKRNIAQAIEEAYGVRVLSVQIINLPSKAKTFGRRQEVGSRGAVKKAIVKLAPGESLEIFKAGV